MSGWKIILIISFFLFNIGYSAFAAESDSDEVFLLPLSSLNDKIFEYPSEVNQEPKRLTLASPEPLSNVSFENPTEVIYDSDSDIITLLEDRVFPSNEADPFQSFFVQHVKNNRDIPETSTHKYFRYSIKFITYPFASMAGIPLLYLVHQAAGNVVALDYIFGVSTVLTAGISRTFVTHQILENLDPMSEEEYLIKAPNNWKSRARHISFYTLGILASLPFTYAVYKYNDVKYLAIITLIAESALNTYAYYQLSFGASLLRCACSSSIDIDNAEKEREEIISSLDHFSLFLTSAPIQRVGQIVKDNITDADTLERFLENIQFEETQEVVAITWKRGYPRKAARFLALSLPMINLTRNAILAWESSKLIYDPIWFSILYTAAIIAPGVVLDVLGTDATVCTLFDNIYHCTTGASQQSFMSEHYPKLNVSSTIFSIFISVLAAGVPWFLTDSTITETFLSSIAIPLTVVNVLGFVMFESYIIRNSSNKLVELYTYYFGNNEQKEALQYSYKASRLSSMFKSMSVKKIQEQQ